MRVAIVVLGDFGRSPRMQYHALALAGTRAEVDVVAYDGSAPFCAVLEEPRIHLHLMSAPGFPARHRMPGPIFVAYASMRACAQSLRLLRTLLLTLDRPDFVLVQNPPAIPTLAIALLAARLRSARLVVDWHNFSYSMLALRLGRDRWAVALLRWAERTLGRRADAHLCVSRAMQSELSRHWRIPGAIVLYDRPAQMFAPAPPESRPAVIRRVLGVGTVEGGKRPAIVVAPTSWTDDEEISLLIEAAVRCDRMVRDSAESANGAFPDVLIIVTGRGPMRDRYQLEIERLTLRKFHLQTLWLSPEDYVAVLGAADLGVCCHRSASGLDLPMKIADLFGAGVPVCALDYGPCLAEQVRHGENGLVFRDAEQLAGQLYELLSGFPAATPMLDRLRGNIVRQHTMRWSDGWTAEAARVFEA